MIPPQSSLLDLIRSTKGKFSKTYDLKHYQHLTYNFKNGYIALIILTICWIFYKLINYEQLYYRPHSLFTPMNYFGKLFMPSFPSKPLFYVVTILALFIATYIICISPKYVFRLILTFLLLWINLFQWSFGYDSDVSQLFLYSHLFSLGISLNLNSWSNRTTIKIITLQLYYCSLLITYSFSGLWKVIGILYKIFTFSTDIHWLHPQAALFNAIVNYRSYDFEVYNILHYYTYPVFWQINFILVLYILVFSFIAAFRLPLLPWAMIALIIFHMVNMLFFKIFFISAPLTLACLFFPYHLFFKKKLHLLPFDTQFQGRFSTTTYERHYIHNNDKDVFTGFYAYREQSYDKHPMLAGLLYVPGLATLITFLWKIFPKGIKA